MSNIKAIKDYAHYRLIAKDAHGIHSPFVFYLYNAVIDETAAYYDFKLLSAIRREIENDQTELEVEDFGAGSKIFKDKKRKVADIARHGISNEKYARLLYRLVNYFAPETSIEIGTSLGLTTMYLAAARKNGMLYTIEGSEEIAAYAKMKFEKYKFKNIELLKGNFDQQLPELLNKLERIDFAYIDGNHSKVPTLNYFNLLLQKCHNGSVLAFDDINWSAEMKEAWAAIKEHKDVTLTIDLFYIGIVFLRKENKNKEHFVLKF